ncbi:STAS domain-containing protein [Sphaerisporangium dianthi]|uniref:STAS domain-containing protein n=1 Tax=Sphaerisporangium dianthi TaxID=1436120 RepID=A0ABV9CC29_9ACTN
MDLQVKVVYRRSESAVVDMSGELDASTSAAAKEFLTSLIQQGCTHILIDGRGLLFCDVAGARVLDHVHARMRTAEGGGLVLLIQPKLRNLFDLLWPGPPDTCPALLVAGSAEWDVPPALTAVPRHVAVIRTLNHQRRPPVRKAEKVSQTASAGTPHPELVRSKRLRAQAESHLQVMRQRVAVTYSAVEEIQQTLAVARATLLARQGVRRAVS